MTIAEARFEPDTERLWINATQFLEPVTADAWASSVGSSPVLAQWLCNHAGRRLSRDEGRGLARFVGSLAAAEARQPDIEALVEDILDGEMVAA